MKKIFFLALYLMLLCACSNKQVKLNLPADNGQIVGLNSLTTVNIGLNHLNLQDFVLNCAEIDSITCSDRNFKIGLRENIEKCDIFVEKNAGTFADLKIWIAGVPYSVPLRKSDKINYKFTFNPNRKTYKKVQIAGQMNNWVASTSPDLQLNSTGLYEVMLNLSPGTYLYQIVLDGEQNHDENNPNKVDNGMGKFNSILQVAGNESKFPHLITKDISAKYFSLTFKNKISEIFVYWENYHLSKDFVLFNKNNITIKIPSDAKEKEYSHIRVWAANSYGISNDILIPLKNGIPVASSAALAKNDNLSKIIYFVLADRFKNGRKENDFPLNRSDVNPMVDYQGGDLEGIRQTINANYFTKLGANTLWISPLNQNPLEPYAYTEIGKSKFSGYHGYWPVSSSKVDFRFGTNKELKNIVQVAHNHNLSVILDYVANHVHQEHPFYKKHPEWATSMYLPDGRRNLELWDEHRLTTWFDTFLPTIDYGNPEVVKMMTDSAMFWIKEFGIDGFRHDACKHVNEEFWRTLTLKIKQNDHSGSFFQIGESYGSPELMASYVNSGMLNGQFDFNVYDEASAAFNGVSGGTLIRLGNILNTSFKMYGVHNQMGYISGNHDKVRFMALASGDLKVGEDAKTAAWTRKIEVTDSTTAYEKLALFHIFNFTIPGVPVIYYGDEIGMTGGNDPDNRRMMKFNNLSKREQSLFDKVAKIAHLRSGNLALIYGDFVSLQVSENLWVYARKYFDNEVIILINNSDEEKYFSVDLPEDFIQNKFTGLFGNSSKIVAKKLMITLKPYSAEVLY
ncbi:MAG: alpha-glucosidase C-terminal domain-containing protein [Prevotellaceae bacterium]|jgi:glycosidase|nr:alpha-glucosidase C-terminal domain-containing protein [Prevotellaceae bacterium]